jgi:hypothetical protein
LIWRALDTIAALTDFLNVVDAQRQFYDLQEQYAAAQVAEGEQFVQLYKSLGSGRESYQAVPAIRRPQRAIIAASRRTCSEIASGCPRVSQVATRNRASTQRLL